MDSDFNAHEAAQLRLLLNQQMEQVKNLRLLTAELLELVASTLKSDQDAKALKENLNNELKRIINKNRLS